MGIPLFIAPVEPDVASKAAEKTAAVSRSSIRRRVLERPSRARVVADARRRRLLGMMVDTEPEEYEVSEPASQPAAPAREGSYVPAGEPPSRARRLSEGDRMRLRDQLSFERGDQREADTDGPLMMPPAPETRDFPSDNGLEDLRRQAELHRLRQARHRQDLRRMARRYPYSHGETTPQTLRGDVIGFSTSSLPPVPRTRDATLDAFLNTGEELGNIMHIATNDRLERRAEFRAAQRSSLAERVEALNRASSSNSEARRRILRQARLDGLGDRDRSLSPDAGISSWDTLLGTITPDPQPPSAGSSFASSAAAAASSSNSGPASASTSLTSIDNAEATDAELPALNDCDVSDDASNTEEEEEDMYELREFNSRRPRSWRSYENAMTAQADRAARTPDDEHMDSMHAIISRLAERDEIPDIWWASAGLSRSLRRQSSS